MTRRCDLGQKDIVPISAIGGESAIKLIKENVINDLIEITCLCGSRFLFLLKNNFLLSTFGTYNADWLGQSQFFTRTRLTDDLYLIIYIISQNYTPDILK